MAVKFLQQKKQLPLREDFRFVENSNNMKYSLVSILLFISFFTFSQNQSYKTVIGVKGGYPGYGSVNVKHNLVGNKYIEASMGGIGRRGYGNGFYLVGDFEINNSLKEGFLWYYGGGALVGLSSYLNNSYFQFAPNAVAGLEYVLEDLPLNISVETGPYLFIAPNVNFVWGGGIALRYVVQ
jgi:hypothetical protein